ncbi:hypothetical protein Vafri_20399 [Volvox africanus]|uniref:Anticodon-binding domain-containing protein n=1 Tax=Volvox africanus TaxID=51714 RepID=A0A8J4BWZ3_9CHLO|nr:hypothetical protein Vafri_20399 [Volvox africanus]
MAAEGVGKHKKPTKAKPDDEQAKLKKRKRDGGTPAATGTPATQQPTATAAPAADGATGGAPAHKKQRRHKRVEEQEPLDPLEAARRQRQRELQERALKLRTEGKEYVPSRKGGKSRSREVGEQDQKGGAGKGAKDKKGRHYLGDKTPGWRPFSSVEVIVLPIFWNNNKEEKAAVLAASERARDILASAGLQVDMDASNKYTPGQKMKYWETMGVRVRVELGPRDVANGNCVVALSTKAPGEVASKNVVNMRHKMLDAVRAALSKAKSAKQDEEDEEEEQHQQNKKGEMAADRDKEQPKWQKGGKDARKSRQAEAADDSDGDAGSGDSEDKDERETSAGGGDESEDADGTVAAAVAAVKSRQGGVLQRASNPEAKKMKQQRGREKVTGHSMAGSSPADTQEETEAAPKAAKQPAVAKAAGGKVPYSADALEDDFGDIVEFEPEEDKLTLSKKERMKKAIKQTKAKRKAERLAGTAGSDDPDGAQMGKGDEGQEEGAEAVQAKDGGKKRPKVVTF